ncbi:flavodoxin family protein [Blastococcus sp. SYSU DS0552]
MPGALVVYESVSGDAKRVAMAVAHGLCGRLSVDVAWAREAPIQVLADVRLLVVGGPTHAFGMPRPVTRETAVREHGAVVPDVPFGLHEWLDAVWLPRGIQAAAFDTRMDHPVLVTALDHAARTEEKLLRRLGATLAAPAEHFLVADVVGPLLDGEEDRARRWGQALGELVAPHPIPVRG